MAGRQYPWDLRPVPWSEFAEFTRGTHEGAILLSWGIAPRDKLATRRQLRQLGLRPGGQEPVALLYFRCRTACKKVFAELYLIDQAKPVRPMTQAKRAAVDKALAARRTCRECRETGVAELPRAHRTCEPCRYSLGLLDETDYLHDYVSGIPTVDAAGHAVLDAAPAESRSAQVIPFPRRSTVAGRPVSWEVA